MSEREWPMMTRREILEMLAQSRVRNEKSAFDEIFRDGFERAIHAVLNDFDDGSLAHELALLMAREREVAAE